MKELPRWTHRLSSSRCGWKPSRNPSEIAVAQHRTRRARSPQPQRHTATTPGRRLPSKILIVLNRDGTTRYQSPAATRLLGYTVAETTGQSGFTFVHPDDLPQVMSGFSQLLHTPEGKIFLEVRVRHHNGSWRRLMVVAVNRLHDPTVEGIVVSCRDRGEARHEAGQARRVRDTRAQPKRDLARSRPRSHFARLVQTQRQFLTNAAHELSNPLAALRMQLEVARKHPERTQWLTFARQLLQEVDQLQHLVDDIFALATIDERSATSYCEPRALIDLKDVLLSEVARLQDRRVHLTKTVDTHIEGNARTLQRAIRNLLENAIRYARRRIDIELSLSSRYLQLVIEDDGPGIPAVERQQVFERFVHRSVSPHASAGKAGLGLAIAQAIVFGHGGNIIIGDSRSGGARFEVTLPLADREHGE
ncbi:MAG: PAS domain-containing sensor histidine kinase [Deltaproteobacteria bacterium]|nr:PAS domain-containing sensor histidine kinase [Deltaproteobacteria bacterium]